MWEAQSPRLDAFSSFCCRTSLNFGHDDEVEVDDEDEEEDAGDADDDDDGADDDDDDDDEEAEEEYDVERGGM